MNSSAFSKTIISTAILFNISLVYCSNSSKASDQVPGIIKKLTKIDCHQALSSLQNVWQHMSSEQIKELATTNNYTNGSLLAIGAAAYPLGVLSGKNTLFLQSMILLKNIVSHKLNHSLENTNHLISAGSLALLTASLCYSGYKITFGKKRKKINL